VDSGSSTARHCRGAWQTLASDSQLVPNVGGLIGIHRIARAPRLSYLVDPPLRVTRREASLTGVVAYVVATVRAERRIGITSATRARTIVIAKDYAGGRTVIRKQGASVRKSWYPVRELRRSRRRYEVKSVVHDYACRCRTSKGVIRVLLGFSI
jgi:hypothetical protein